MLHQPEVAVDRTREGADLLAALGDSRNEAWARLNLANAYHALGRRGHAVDAVRRAITLAQAVGSAPEEAEALETGADLQESAGDHAAAVASRAAAEAIRQARRMGRPPDEQVIWERALARLRERLGADAYRRAWGRGSQLTVAAAGRASGSARHQRRRRHRPSHRWRRPRRWSPPADDPRAGRPGTGRTRPVRCRDLRSAGHLAQDGQRPRLEHQAEAGCRHAATGRAAGPRRRSGGRTAPQEGPEIGHRDAIPGSQVDRPEEREVAAHLPNLRRPAQPRG